MIGKLVTIIFCAVVQSAVCCPPQYGFGPASTCRRDDRVYPIVLPHCGPEPCPAPTVNAPPIFAPPQEGPLIPLPHPPIPAPQVIAHKCVCTKTILKPQVIQRVINVPKIERYLKRTFRPVVENIQYVTSPQCCEYPQPPFPCRVPHPIRFASGAPAIC